MTGLKLDKTLTLGNVLVLATMVAGGLGAWFQIGAAVDANAQAINSAATSIMGNVGDIRGLTSENRATAVQLGIVLTDIKSLERQLLSLEADNKEARALLLQILGRLPQAGGRN